MSRSCEFFIPFGDGAGYARRPAGLSDVFYYYGIGFGGGMGHCHGLCSYSGDGNPPARREIGYGLGLSEYGGVKGQIVACIAAGNEERRSCCSAVAGNEE